MAASDHSSHGMSAHWIGQQLRAAVLQDRQQGRPLDPLRLQAVIGDLCAGGHEDLVAPLRYLVLSGAFASAAAMEPPLADGRQLPRLQNELAQMYAGPLCVRLQPVLEGLLDRPESARMSGPGPIPAGSAPAPLASQPAAVGSGGGNAVVIVLLAGLSSLLLLALAVVGLLLWQRHGGGIPQGALPGSNPSGASAPSAQPQPQAAPQPPTLPAPDAPVPGGQGGSDQAAALDRAVASIQELYGALSAKDFSRAEGLYGSAAADQFTPEFFRQFERVTVQDLRSTSQVGSTVNLEGVVTFVWPDGTLQSETRSFSVDTASSPARITGSEFGQVLSARH